MNRQTQNARLAEEVDKAAARLLKALRAERSLRRKRGQETLDELTGIQRTVDHCAEQYLKALSRYVEFYQQAAGDSAAEKK